jgi:hypothetical protein
LSGVQLQGEVRVGRNGGAHPTCRLGVGAVAAEPLGELVLLGVGEAGVHVAFDGDLGGDEFVLVGHRDVLAGSHREGPRYQTREAGQHDRRRGATAATDSGDQRGVGDQAVHGSEDRGSQPSPDTSRWRWFVHR